ncbi:CPBP family intramembrane glutamic endopeptidase [Nocardioides sp. GCM10028917]|uniref:CPBP family intramembrane glutamic endopeptidase n=1 Tax=Nocardioides sp. GCM10028917 TaxID=3273408 RepID=UPI00361E6E29
MSHTLKVYLAIVLGWAALAGALLRITGIDLDSLMGAAVIALLYMPSPMVAALIAERGFRRDRLRLPRRGVRPVAVYLLLPAAAVVAFVLLFLGAVLVGSALLGVDATGQLALTQEQIMDGAASLVGQDAVDAAGEPPPAAVLLVAGMWGALVAGSTINGVFAMGEEYGWRGLMWDELRAAGPVRANLLIGLAWGVWHAPLIVQGYNYPEFPGLGVLSMVAFCTGMSFVLTAVRQLTGSLIPVAATHGMFNAIAPILLILAPDAHPILGGPLGLLGAAIFALLGAAAWAVTRRGSAHGNQVSRNNSGRSTGPSTAGSRR